MDLQSLYDYRVKEYRQFIVKPYKEDPFSWQAEFFLAKKCEATTDFFF